MLEFLIKNGSERVIDDARAHLSLLKMLRQFHFIDQNGKDQGLNVRNRAKELAELLSDVEKIRAERKKSRATRNKYGGLEGGSSFGSSMSGGGGRYGGFSGNDLSFGGYSGGVYGDGGGFGGNTGGFNDSGGRRDRFEEYDEGDDPSVASSTRRTADTASAPTTRRDNASKKKAEPPKPKEPDVDLLSVDDPVSSGPSAAASSSMGASQSGGADDDEFDDFQSAAPSIAASTNTLTSSIPPPSMASSMSSLPPFAAPKPVSGNQGAGLSNLVAFSSVSPAPASTSTSYSLPPAAAPMAQPAGFQSSQPNYFTSVPVAVNQSQLASGTGPAKAAVSQSASTQPTKTSKPATSSSGGDAFGSIWSSASATVKKSNTPSQQQGPNLASMAKEKASAGIWGAAAAGNPQSSQRPLQSQSQSGSTGTQQKLGGGLDDLLS